MFKKRKRKRKREHGRERGNDILMSGEQRGGGGHLRGQERSFCHGRAAVIIKDTH